MRVCPALKRLFPAPFLAVALVAVLFALPGRAESGEGSVYDELEKGKKAFQAECRKCHTIKYALDETYSEDDWYMTVNTMIDNGADLNKEQKELIIGYLIAKTAFQTKCNVCHELERPLSKKKDLEQWQATVKRMSSKREGHLTDGEAEVISAFLALGFPEAKD
jgi:cytochrome c2